MSLNRVLPALLILATLSGVLMAQESPYTRHQDREIKALSAQQVADLEEGRGMGLALAAELNGYPGPKHVLELADSLGLDEQTVAAVREVHDRMQLRARDLGAAIVAEEAKLDSVFAAGEITTASLTTQVARIAVLSGRLRTAHLQAHLETTALLSPEQRHEYQRLRGYRMPEAHDGAGHDH